MGKQWRESIVMYLCASVAPDPDCRSACNSIIRLRPFLAPTVLCLVHSRSQSHALLVLSFTPRPVPGRPCRVRPSDTGSASPVAVASNDWPCARYSSWHGGEDEGIWDKMGREMAGLHRPSRTVDLCCDKIAYVNNN